MPRESRHLTLVAPGLLGPLPAGALDLVQPPDTPALRLLLARADAEPVSVRGLDPTLFHLFGLPAAAAAQPPVADATRRADGLADADEAVWLRADPVHLHPEGDSLVVRWGPDLLGLGDSEAEDLVAVLNRDWAEAGMQLYAPVPDRWYLRLTESPAMRTRPLSWVLGRAVDRHLPTGEAADLWRRRLNEAQMVLHGTLLNQQREAAGQPGVNSLWFWGEGRLPEPPPTRWDGIWADEARTRGLAAWLGATRQPLPQGPETLLNGGAGRQLAVTDDLYEPVMQGDVTGWEAALRDFEADWAAPLLAALRDGRLETLVLHPCGGRGLRITRSSLRRFWKRPRPLSRALLSYADLQGGAL